MVELTERQKQLLAGSFMLALGLAVGVVIDSDDPLRDDKLAELGSAVGSAIGSGEQLVDTAEYNLAVLAVRNGRTDIFDVLTPLVAPGEAVTTIANGPLGIRPESIDFVGPSFGRFTIRTDLCKDCGLFFEDDAERTRTQIRIVAKNTSPDAVRLTAFVHVTPGGP